MIEVLKMLGISEAEEINDDCVPFSGEGICPTCKHLHKVEPFLQGSYAEMISGWKPKNPDDYYPISYNK